jgi:predicted acylesterase/phospholipase RssA
VMPPLPPWWAMLMVLTMCCGCSLGSLNEALMACAGGRSFELRLQKFES